MSVAGARPRLFVACLEDDHRACHVWLPDPEYVGEEPGVHRLECGCSCHA